MALFEHMDVDGNRVIDGVEFTRYFFKVGNEFHQRIRDRDERIREEERRISEEKARLELEKQQQKEEGVISEHTDEEANMAMMKLCDHSFLFDAKNFINQQLVQYFKCHLTPYEFKLQLEKSFQMKVTAAELGALVKRYAYDEFRVDGEGFLNDFLALHHQQVAKHNQLWEERFYIKRFHVEKAKRLDNQIYPKFLGR